MPRELPIPPTVAAQVRHIEYAEVSANVTVVADSTIGRAVLTLPAKAINIQSIRVYAPADYTGTYTIEIFDSEGNVIYRFTDASGTIVDLVQVTVSDPNAQLIAKITLPTAPTTDTTFSVKLGFSYVA